MFKGLYRFISNTFSKSFNYQLQPVSKVNPTQSELSGLIRQYFTLYNQARSANTTIHWNREKQILDSLDFLIPHLPGLDPYLTNLLIINLSYLYIHNHRIWKHLEECFIKSSHKFIEIRDTPHLITGFSAYDCKEPKVWEILDKKMIEYILYNNINTVTAALTLKAMAKVNKGSEKLLNMLKNQILIDIDELQTPVLTSIISNLSKRKEKESDFLQILIARLLKRMDEVSMDDLSKLLTTMFIIKLDYELIKLVEKKILEKIQLIELKHIAAMIGNYYLTSGRLKHKSTDFPQIISKYYQENRSRLSEESNKSPAYDCKILGLIILLNYELNTELARNLFQTIKKNEADLMGHLSLNRFYLVIENYLKTNMKTINS